MSEPKIETVAAAQTRTNDRLLQSGGGERVAHGREHCPWWVGLPARRRPGTACGTLAPLGASELAHRPVRPARRSGPSPSLESRTRTMFDTLSDRLRKTLGNLTGRGRISEADVDAAMREVRLALLEADVNFKVVKDFVARVRERAIGARGARQPVGRPAGRQDRQRRARRAPVGRRPDLPPVGQPGGRRDGRPPGLGQDDLDGQARATRREARSPAPPRRRGPVSSGRRRPARDARRSLGIPVYRAPVGTSVVDIARGGVEAARRQVRDVVILDTAGRLSIDEALMAEIAAVNDGGPSGRDASRGRCHDRPGGRRRRPGVRRRGPGHRPDPDQDRRRCARRCRPVDLGGHRRPGQVHRAPARRPTPSRSSTPTGWPAGSSAWATS